MPSGYNGGGYDGYPMYAGGSASASKADGLGAAGSYDDLHEHGAFTDPQQQQGLLSGASGAGVSWAAHTPATAARERWMQRQDEQYGSTGYNEKGNGKSSRKWWWIGGVALVVIAAIGIGAGVAVARSKGSKDKAKGVVTSDKNDPSKFTKDSRLHKSFYGMCYTPTDTQYPACGASQDAIIEDIQLLSQLTPRVRLYGADCDVGNLVLTAIEKTKVDLSVYLGVWVDDNDETWQRQLKTTQDVVTKHGVDHIAGISVGNEYLLNGGSVTTLLSRVSDVRTWVTAQNFNKTVPVGTGDAGSMITTEVAEGAEFVFENNHPFFGGVPIDQAAGWVWDYTNNNDPGIAVQAATNKPEVFIAEVGWPSGANDTASATYQAAVAGVSELQTFLDTYVCQSNANVTAENGSDVPSSKSFFFELMDEEWKDKMYGGVEGHWGLFDTDKQLKNITIPDCATP